MYISYQLSDNHVKLFLLWKHSCLGVKLCQRKFNNVCIYVKIIVQIKSSAIFGWKKYLNGNNNDNPRV